MARPRRGYAGPFMPEFRGEAALQMAQEMQPEDEAVVGKRRYAREQARRRPYAGSWPIGDQPEPQTEESRLNAKYAGRLAPGYGGGGGPGGRSETIAEKLEQQEKSWQEEGVAPSAGWQQGTDVAAGRAVHRGKSMSREALIAWAQRQRRERMMGGVAGLIQQQPQRRYYGGELRTEDEIARLRRGRKA